MKKIDLTLPVLAIVAIVVFSFLYFNSDDPGIASNVVGVDNTAEPGILGNAIEGQNDELIPTILLKEANIQQITVSQDDIDNAINSLIARSNLTEEKYYEFVLTTYPDKESFKAKIEDNLRILKLVDLNVDLTQINITDDDVDEFINGNKEVMPIDQLGNDPVFKQNFYRLAKQQMLQNKHRELVNAYIQKILDKYSES